MAAIVISTTMIGEGITFIRRSVLTRRRFCSYFRVSLFPLSCDELLLTTCIQRVSMITGQSHYRIIYQELGSSPKQLVCDTDSQLVPNVRPLFWP